MCAAVSVSLNVYVVYANHRKFASVVLTTALQFADSPVLQLRRAATRALLTGIEVCIHQSGGSGIAPVGPVASLLCLRTEDGNAPGPQWPDEVLRTVQWASESVAHDPDGQSRALKMRILTLVVKLHGDE